MIWLGLVLLILLLLFLLIIFSKLTIIIKYYHHNDNDDFKVQLRLWFGLIRYTIKAPMIKVDDDSPSVIVKSKSKMHTAQGEKGINEEKVHQIEKDDITSKLQSMKEILDRVIGMKVIVRKFLKKMTIKQFEWHSLIGIGDAAHTGVLSGAIWGLKGSFIGLLSHYLNLSGMPRLSVTPHFQAVVAQTELTCIIQFRIGHAILAGLKLIRFWKGGLPHLKNNSAKEKTKSV